MVVRNTSKDYYYYLTQEVRIEETIKRFYQNIFYLSSGASTAQ